MAFFTSDVKPSGRCSTGCPRCDSAIVVKPLAGPPDMFPHGDGFAVRLAELAVCDDGTVIVCPARDLTPGQIAKVWEYGKALRDQGMAAVPAPWMWDSVRGLWTTNVCEPA